MFFQMSLYICLKCILPLLYIHIGKVGHKWDPNHGITHKIISTSVIVLETSLKTTF